MDAPPPALKFPRPRFAGVLGLVLGLMVAGNCPGRTVVDTPAAARAMPENFRKAAERVLPSVVTIRDLGASVKRGAGATSAAATDVGGSGVVLDPGRGLILTNDHVVRDASQVRVVLPDGRQRAVSAVKRDPESDLAVLSIDPVGLPAAVTWGDSTALGVGDWVLAVGQPFGLPGSVTAGIVSATGRSVGVARFEDLIQTDAAVNPGNSGGPLVDLEGRVVGINVAIRSLTGGYDGVGFAVPSNRARRIASDLAEHGGVRRSYLGASLRLVSAELADKLDHADAVVLERVTPNGPAAKAGLVSGDVVVAIDGRRVRGEGMLRAVVEFATGEPPLVFRVWREGATRSVEVRPEPRPVGDDSTRGGTGDGTTDPGRR